MFMISISSESLTSSTQIAAVSFNISPSYATGLMHYVTRDGSFFDVMAGYQTVGRITSEIVRGIGVTQLIGVGCASNLAPYVVGIFI